MKFSIIIPVYNVAPYLRECLDSVLAQLEPDWECICVDDGSLDESGAVLDEYAAKDRRFRVVHKANEGVSVARNVGLDMAHGEYVVFIDGDDSVRDDWLMHYGRVFELSKADLVRMKFGWDAARDGHVVPTGRSLVSELDVGGHKCRLYVEDRLKHWAWNQVVETGCVWGFAVRREIASKARFEPGVAFCEDSLYIMQLVPYLRKAVQSDCAGYVYRVRSGSAMRSAFASEERLKYLKAIGRVAEEIPDIDKAMLSRACIGNALCWAERHKDTKERVSIRREFLSLHRRGFARSQDVGLRAKVPYWVYRLTGLLWPVVAWHCLIVAMARIKRVVRK